MSKQNELVELARTGASGGGNKNLIINGAMSIAQRGTSSTTDSYKTVDRFRNNIGGPSITQTQETLTSGDPYDLGFRHFYRQTNTSASSATNSNVQIFQIIEAQDIASSGWNYTSSSSYISVSFWVRSSLAGTYPVCFRTYDGTSYWYASEFTIAANTWTKITKKVSGNSNLQFDNDNGAGLQVNVSPHFDTDFTDSGFIFDQWAAFNGSSRSKDYAQDWGNTLNATFDITGVQVEVGEKATDFEHRSYADELAKAQRYYYKLPINSYGPYLCQYVSGNRFSHFWHPVPMRAVPTSTTTISSGTVQEFTPDTHHTKYYNSAAYNNTSTFTHTAYQADAEL